MSSQLLGRPFKKYATIEGDPIDGCTRISRGMTYFGTLVELGQCREATSDDRVTHHSAPLATTADEGNTISIAPVGMPTAGSPSCEGLIDGRARGHW